MDEIILGQVCYIMLIMVCFGLVGLVRLDKVKLC